MIWEGFEWRDLSGVLEKLEIDKTFKKVKFRLDWQIDSYITKGPMLIANANDLIIL